MNMLKIMPKKLFYIVNEYIAMNICIIRGLTNNALLATAKKKGRSRKRKCREG